MMLEVTGRRLARRCLEAAADNHNPLLVTTLADYLPERPIGWPCWPEIAAISALISLPALKSPDATAEAFTALLYQQIEKQSIDGQRCGEVMGFFRGFCRAFFHPVNAGTSPSAKSRRSNQNPVSNAKDNYGDAQRPNPTPQELQENAAGLLNFNDLLGMLLDWCSKDNPGEICDHTSATWDADELVPLLVRLIEAMERDERLNPEMLLGGFCSDHCVLRRKRLSYAAGLDLETVDILMTNLSSLRRFYRSDPLALSSAEHT
jgi:hypothetical protein